MRVSSWLKPKRVQLRQHQALDLAPLFARYGELAVCTTGIERLTHTDSIDSSKLDRSDWEEHMAEKSGFDMADFGAALEHAPWLKQFGYIG